VKNLNTSSFRFGTIPIPIGIVLRT